MPFGKSLFTESNNDTVMSRLLDLDKNLTNGDSGVASFLDQYAQPPVPILPGFAPASPGSGGPTAELFGKFGFSLGTPVQLSSNDVLTPIQSASHSGASGRSGTGIAGTAPAPTLVTTAGSGLQFKLIWDASVSTAPTSFMNGVIAAAQEYERLYTSPGQSAITLNIQVGYGEVNGTALGAGALGESSSNGYLTNYATMSYFLRRDASNSSYNSSADATLGSTDPTHGGRIFYTSAEGKALGMVSGASTAVDGSIGISSAYPMDYTTDTRLATNGATAGGAFDAVAIAAHEISEVMGRLGSVGSIFGSNIYSALDLFRYSSSGVHDVTPTSGYFSVDGGHTNLGNYNNPAAGGDAADWASAAGFHDSYLAAVAPGNTAPLSANDMIENAVLGYKMTSLAVADTLHPTVFA
jgi:hypothetical protein